MVEGTGQKLVWEWGGWRAYAVPMRPLERPVAAAWLVVFDDVTEGSTAGRWGPLLNDAPFLSVLVDDARRATPRDVRVLPAGDVGWKGVLYVPVLHGEPWPLAAVVQLLAQPGSQIVVPASDALRLDVRPRVLAAWLRGGLAQGGGIVALAASTEIDLATLHSWAGRAARMARPSKPGAAGGAAKVVGVGAAAALGLAVAAWVERKVADVRAKDRTGLGSFRPEGDTSASRLVAILHAELPTPRWTRLVRRARGRKGRGEDLAVVEEWVHLQPDPARALAGLFAPFEFGPLARKHLDLELGATTDGREMAELILTELGFFREPEQLGLAGALGHTELLRARWEAGDMDPREAALLGPTLERVTKCLLAFHLRLAFRSAAPLDALYARYLQAHSTGSSAPVPPSRRGLGGLGHALEDFERWRVAGTEARARERHAAVYQQRPLGRDRLRILAGLRNDLAHDRAGARPDQIAPRLLGEAGAWLAQLRSEEAGPRLFPALVRVEGVTTTRTGLLVTGIDDEGRKEEIHPRKPLVPGTSWYMVPVSNPVRVRPLLVPAE